MTSSNSPQKTLGGLLRQLNRQPGKMSTEKTPFFGKGGLHGSNLKVSDSLIEMGWIVREGQQCVCMCGPLYMYEEYILIAHLYMHREREHSPSQRPSNMCACVCVCVCVFSVMYDVYIVVCGVCVCVCV